MISSHQTSPDPSSNQDQTVLPSSNHKIPTIVNNDIRDAWDNDEWGSLEEEPVIEELEEKSNDMNHHSPASRSNSNSHSSSGNHHNNNHSVSPSKDNGSSGDNLLNSNSNSYSNTNWDNYGTSWNDDEFEPIDDSNGGKRMIEILVGPVFSSDHASRLGLNVSLMERALKSPNYQINETTGKFNANYITQLLDNFRSHPAILQFSNVMFYESKLRAKIEEPERSLGTTWNYLKNSRFPIIATHQVNLLKKERAHSTTMKK